MMTSAWLDARFGKTRRRTKVRHLRRARVCGVEELGKPQVRKVDRDGDFSQTLGWFVGRLTALILATYGERAHTHAVRVTTSAIINS